MSRIILEFKSWFLVNEESASIGGLPSAMQRAIYKNYVDTYSEKGLKPWTWDEFIWRATKWQMYGTLPRVNAEGQEEAPERTGYVTARDEHGVTKLTGMQGPSAKAKLMGMKELAETGKPIWGAMDKDFVERLKKLGFSSPPPSAMKLLMPIIQQDSMFSSGGSWGSLNPDGGINFDLSGVGATVKYFTGNKKFFRQMLEKHGPKMGLDAKMLGILKQWDSIPAMMKQMAMPKMTAKGIDMQTMDWLGEVMSDSPAAVKTPAPAAPVAPNPAAPTGPAAPGSGVGLGS